MRHGWRCFVALTRMELVRLLRTREVWTRMLVPALLLPVVMLVVAVGGVTVVLALEEPGVVALGPDTPEDLPVAVAFEAEGWEVRWVDDPRAAVRDGTADLGLGPWIPGAGMGTEVGQRLVPMDKDPVWVGVLPGDRFLWTVHVWDSESTDGDRLYLLNEVETTVFEGLLASHGVDPEAWDWPVRFHRVEPDVEADERKEVFDLPAVLGHQLTMLDFLQVFAAVMASALGLQVLGLGPVSDRTEGIFETLATTAAPHWAVLAARAVSSVLVLGFATVLVSVPLAGIVRLVEPDVVSPATGLAYLVSAVVFCCGCYLPVGTLGRSLQEANTLGSYGSTVAMMGGSALVLLPAPSAVLFSVAWMALWVVGLAATGVLARPPKADTQ